MRAVVLDSKGGPEILTVRDGVAAPEPQGEEVRVRVHAFAINRADVLQRRGLYPAPPDAIDKEIPGLEYAGEVEALGPRARMRAIGERVFGITGAGAYAQRLCVHERATMRIPDGMPFVDAAAVPEAFMTAFDALAQGGFAPGGSVLIHAVGSGVGLAALQLVATAGGTAIGTSRTAEKLARAQPYGLAASALLDEAWDELARRHTHGAGVDVVLDFIGPSVYARNLAALRIGGRVVQIGTLAGGKAEIEIGLLMQKRATWIGTTLRARPIEEKIALARTFERLVVPQFGAGRLRAAIDTVYEFEQIAEAHRRMESDRSFGKIVVKT
ncbi:MAG: NAD(P)H-quinone oxidoreductase [Candidatus Eremiobacteraeota bacterium]|nr:NAD(P)H-quinone oxidoreductase [Candidatus Eremiobacteraeota bacterium]